MVRAYNDWHIDKWCGAEPGRFIPLSIPVIWDPELAAEEVRRVAKKGCHAVTFSENPEKLGWPSLHNPHWDPFWTACADEGTVVCMHLGSSSSILMTSVGGPDRRHDQPAAHQHGPGGGRPGVVPHPAQVQGPCSFALSEGGIGWIPYALERIDYVYQHHHDWTGQDFGDRLPSQVFHDHILTCFIDDAFGVANRHYINIDNIMWECDYPHSDSTWPQSPEAAMKYLDGVPDDEIDKITHLNAMRHFSSTPSAIARGSVAPSARCGPRRPTSTLSATGPRREGRDGIVSVTGFTTARRADHLPEAPRPALDRLPSYARHADH